MPQALRLDCAGLTGVSEVPKRLRKKSGVWSRVRGLREDVRREGGSKRMSMFRVTWEGSERDREKQDKTARFFWKDRQAGQEPAS